ncbi:prepilin-type N-terminal cleavage/methylation domain-containing protein [Shewanella sp. YIC-542]|uniref:prepilin-type N-terminal cleavage/methylation domain-containing protein n=1 Tax=Shewanella mytili TaxID=3377111 RepID=UPI00398EE686
MKKNGFTLIELVTVIIILGIIAAIALPKFIGLQKESKEADLKALAATLETTISLVHVKAALQGKDREPVNKNDPSRWVDYNGSKIPTHYGYPLPFSLGDTSTLAPSMLDLDGFKNFEQLKTLHSNATVFLLNSDPRKNIDEALDKDVAKRHCLVLYEYAINISSQPTITFYDGCD